MIYIENNSQDPYFNLALEEFLLEQQQITDDMFLLWQNSNTIVVGRNQNVYEEINLKSVIADQVKVVRRLSGGGTVYHDLGNLNFTFIKQKNSWLINNYDYFLKIIVETLRKLGLEAQFSGKNDLLINEKKISGNAQYANNQRILHHGTLLFDVDLTKLNQYLRINPLKLQSKGIKSNKSQVTNILPLLKTKITIQELKELIVSELVANNFKKVVLSNEQVAAVVQLARQKYATWGWNFGVSPDFTIKKHQFFLNKGTINLGLNVSGGIIKNIKIHGDFMGYGGTEIIEQQLIGCRYDVKDISLAIEKIDLQEVFGSDFQANEIINLII